MLRGQQFSAGVGLSTVLPDLDFETYSEAGYLWQPPTDKHPLGRWQGPPGAPGSTRGIGVVGAAVYAQHPSTEVLSLAYDLKDGGGPRHWLPGYPLPQDLFDWVAAGGLLEAWNSAFEGWIWNWVCVRRYGFPPLPLPQLRCAMGKARASGWPGKLGEAAAVMGLPDQKDKAGDALLKLFSVPQNPTKADPLRRRVLPGERPDDAASLYRYNLQDIKAEAAASVRTPDLDPEELAFWLADQAINARGVHIDRPGVDNCIAIVEAAHAKYDAELTELTNGVVTAASQVQRLSGWLGAQGCLVYSLDEDSVTAMLKRLDDRVTQGDMHPDEAAGPYRALEIRQAVGSASVKKVFAMANQCAAGDRLHDLFSYHAARTGRATGNGPQPTNLPKGFENVFRCASCSRHFGTHTVRCPWCLALRAPGAVPVEWCVEAVDDALQVIAGRSYELVEHVFGDAMGAVSGCLRGLFTAADGHDLIASDYNSIEAVVLAVLAGEQWRIDVFRTHGKIYELSVSKIAGIPFEEILDYKKRTGQHHPLRQTVGKVAELASGYQGWLGAWKAFGADAFMNDEQIKDAILKWRDASPAVVEFWGGQERRRPWRVEMYGVEGMAISAVENPGQAYAVRRADGAHTGVTFKRVGDALYCKLPSGRKLTYHRPRVEPGNRGGLALSYEGWNTNPKNGPPGWIRMNTWGGRLVENIVQAVARDILRHAIVNLERVGYPVVLHVYDEIVAEVRHGLGSVEQFEQIMMQLEPWAAGWPIKASGGWRGLRYRKG